MDAYERSPGSQPIAATIKSLMIRNKVLERQHSKKLGEILNLSYSQAHRKLNADTDWTLAQLRDVAAYFGESIGSLGLSDFENGSEQVRPKDLESGIFVAVPGTHEYQCEVSVGEQLTVGRRADFVAYRDRDEWRIVQAEHCPEDVVRYKVNKLHIVVSPLRVPTIAVLDDEHGFANNMRDFLNENGFNATAFYTATALERFLKEQGRFDGYILDWILGTRTAESLIRSIRVSGQTAEPVFLLTGEVATGLASEHELARVITQLDVQIREKPIRLPTFTAELRKSLGV